CRFRTSRGQLGIDEHTRLIHGNTPAPTTPSPTAAKPSAVERIEGSRGLHCPYTNCNYTTTSGKSLRANLQKHIKRTHRNKPFKGNTVKVNFGQKVGSTQQKISSFLKSKRIERCTFNGCDYTTIWGVGTLNKHLRAKHGVRSIASPKTESKPQAFGSPTRPKTQSVPNPTQTTSIAKRLTALQSPVKTNGLPLRCTKCSFVTRNGFYKLKQHMAIHSRELPFKCTKCDASFGRPSDLTNHQKSYHKSVAVSTPQPKRNYQNKCTECSKVFRWPSDLKRHVLSSHKTSRPNTYGRNATTFEDLKPTISEQHTCPHDDCRFTTDDLDDLQKHVVMHYIKKEKGIKLSDIEIETSGTTSDNNYVVKQEFGSNESKPKSSLSLSKRIMNSLFKCDEKDCDFSCNNSEEWVKHNDWHQSKEKPRFKCIRCQKSYSKHSQLKAHQRSKRHVSYDCEFCQEMFKTPNLRVQHMISAQHMSNGSDPHMTNTVVESKSPNNHMFGSELMNMLSKPQIETNPTNANYFAKCPYIKCRQKFKLRAVMTFHFNKCHKNIKDESLICLTEGMSRCPDCGQVFNKKSNMKRHRTKVHRNDTTREGTSLLKPSTDMLTINPEIFNATFPSLSSSQSLDPQPNSYFCRRNGCGKWFDSPLRLREHLNAEHNREIKAKVEALETESEDLVDDTSPEELEEGVLPEDMEEEGVSPEEAYDEDDHSTRCDICNVDLGSAQGLDLHFKYVHFQVSDESETIEESIKPLQPLADPTPEVEQIFETIVPQSDDNYDMITLD
ncbi:unnamed protein product, partial [Medioppia subpectinata]